MGIGSDLDRPLNAGGGVAIDVFQGPVADASPRLPPSAIVQGSLALSRNDYLTSRQTCSGNRKISRLCN